MNDVKRFWNNLDKDQKDVLKSTSIVVGLVFVITAFIDVCPGYVFIIFPIQFIVTVFGFVNPNISKTKNGFMDKNSKKKFKKSAAILLLLVASSLTVISILTADLLSHNSPLLIPLFLLPLLIPRAIIFYLKLPLSVMYVLWNGRGPRDHLEHLWSSSYVYRGRISNSHYNE